MPRQQAARQHQHQQPNNSFSTSADSSTSYLSAKPKSHSPRSNFNPFSPLSPHPPDIELEGSEEGDNDESGAMFNMEHTEARRVYTRRELVTVGDRCRQRGFVKPKGMGSLESWYGTAPAHVQDPAIASIGSAPGRRNGGGGGGGGGGFGEGFGYGGGIGGKGLNRGGRNNGPRRNDHDAHGSTTGPMHGSVHGLPHGSGSKDMSGGAMGKFAVKSTSEKLKIGGDENRKPKEDWRRDNPPHQPQRNDHRHWNHRQEEDATPAWMEDQPDHDPAISHIQEDSAPEADRLQKRATRAEGSERRPLVGFFASEATPAPAPAPAKPVKEYKAAKYLLPKQNHSHEPTPSSNNRQHAEPEPAPLREIASSSRFARSFGNLGQSEEKQNQSLETTSALANKTHPPPPPAEQVALSRASQPVASQPPPMSPAQSPPPPSANRSANLLAMLAPGARAPSSRPPGLAPTPPPAPVFHNQAAYSPMQPPPGYGLMQPNAGHDFRPMPQYYTGQAPPPLPPQQLYGSQPPPLFYQSHPQQGFLPPQNPGGQPPYFPPPPPGFAPEPQFQHFYPGGHGHLPMQSPPPQQSRNPAQTDRNLNVLLNQWPQHP